MTEVIKHHDYVANCGDTRTTIFDNGKVQITLYGPVVTTFHLNRDDAVRFSKNLEDLVAAYDADEDRYNESKDDHNCGMVEGRS